MSVLKVTDYIALLDYIMWYEPRGLWFRLDVIPTSIYTYQINDVSQLFLIRFVGFSYFHYIYSISFRDMMTIVY